MTNLNLITNEKVSKTNHFAFCDNIEMKSLVNGLSNNFEVNFFCRKSTQKKAHFFKTKNLIINKNIFDLIFNLLRIIKRKNSIYLLVSITPYTFLSFIFLLLFNKKFYLYLRSDGFEEYKKILGSFGYYIYYIMFFFITKKAIIISNNKKILRGRRGFIIQPSILDKSWKIKNYKKIDLKKIKLLYVGRFKIEKGIFSLINIFKKIKLNLNLTIVGCEQEKSISKISRIKFFKIISNRKKLIKIYDNHTIFILPSFTESYGMVIDEALIRGRPVIIFNEIKKMIKKRLGVYSCERNQTNLEKKINFIVNNYTNIQKKIKKNKFSYETDFILDFAKILHYKRYKFKKNTNSTTIKS